MIKRPAQACDWFVTCYRPIDIVKHMKRCRRTVTITFSILLHHKLEFIKQCHKARLISMADSINALMEYLKATCGSAGHQVSGNMGAEETLLPTGTSMSNSFTPHRSLSLYDYESDHSVHSSSSQPSDSTSSTESKSPLRTTDMPSGPASVTADTTSLLKEENTRLWRIVTDLSTALQNTEAEVAFLRTSNVQSYEQGQKQFAMLAQWRTSSMAEYEILKQMSVELAQKESHRLKEQETAFTEQARLLHDSNKKIAECQDLLGKYDQALRTERGVTDAQRIEIQCLRLEIENLQISKGCQAPTLLLSGSRPAHNAGVVGACVPSNVTLGYLSSS